MAAEKLTEFQFNTLNVLLKQANGEHIYKIDRKKAQSLIKKGYLERREGSSYYLTDRARQLMTEFTERPKRSDATQKLVGFVLSLGKPRPTRQEIVEHLQLDAGRGVDTSPKFMQKKGRRQPRRTGKA